MGSERISVIVPVYNLERELPRCLDSLTGQTHEDLEILLVDDGSRDGSGAICDAYAQKDGRIRTVHKENGGVSSARNVGLSAATGSWVGFVDGDDWAEADMFAYLLDLALRTGADIAQCGCYFDSGTASEIKFAPGEERVASGGGAGFSAGDWALFSNGSCNRLYRRALLGQTVFRPEYPIGEDLRFNLELLDRLETIAFGPAAKYHYVQREDSACHIPPTAKALAGFRAVFLSAVERCAPWPEAQAHFQVECLRNDMDICSKLTRFPVAESGALEKEVRREVREQLGWALRRAEFSKKEKCKLALIGGAWPVYQTGLPLWKSLAGER